MAVADRTWRPYAGPVRGSAWRFLVVSRHTSRFVFQSRIFTSFYVVAALVWPALCSTYVYLRYNARALSVLSIPVDRLAPVDAVFFQWFLEVQALFVGFVIVLFAGPGLISRDLSHGALPLILSRPFSRWEYLAGKAAVLIALLSVPTWIAGVYLYTLQAALARGTWFLDNLRLLAAVVAGSLGWIAFLTLVVLALSALVRRRMLGALLLLALFLAASVGAAVFVEITGKDWAGAFHPFWAADRLFAALLGVRARQADIPLAAAVATLAIASALAFLLLHRKVRAYEVSR